MYRKMENDNCEWKLLEDVKGNGCGVFLVLTPSVS